MTILRDVAGMLFGMFMADRALSGAVLCLVGLVGIAIKAAGLHPLYGGAALIVGCIGIIAVVTMNEARRRRG